MSFDAQTVVGLDEAGRGPLISRVYAAAVVFLSDPVLPDGIIIRDSKTMTTRQLEKAYDYVKEYADDWSISFVDEKDIDRYNILNSVYGAWHASLEGLTLPFDHILVDGNRFLPYRDVSHTCVVKGDSKHLCISAASILAKVERDRYVRRLAERHPLLQERYDILSNVGYPTKRHLQGIETHGISQFHRRTFSCCRERPINLV